MNVPNIIIKVPSVKKGSGYNPYQTCHGAYEDKRKSRARGKQEFKKLLDRELAKMQ